MALPRKVLVRRPLLALQPVVSSWLIFVFGIALFLNLVNLTPSLAIAAVSTNNSPTSTTPVVRSMKLFSATTGWVLTEQSLLWTTNGGKQWTDITPSAFTNQPIQEVFFLDTSNGWILTSGPKSSIDNTTTIQVAITNDAGKTWLVKTVTTLSIDYSGPASLNFVDTLHGWAMLRLASNANFSRGELFATNDGGNSWKKLPEPPIGDPVRFVNANNGWLAGGSGGDKFYSTRDGGNSWQSQAVPSPLGGLQNNQPSYDLPTFQTAQNGVLPVTFAGPPNKAGVAFYTTLDAGKTWILTTTLPSTDEISTGVKAISSIVNSKTWVTALPGKAEVALIEDINKSSIILATNKLPPNTAIIQLDFVSSMEGWIMTSTGECAGFKTQCSQESKLWAVTGGQIVTDLSPTLPPDPNQGKPKSGATQITTQQGFDTCAAPSTTQMQTWWNSSPYRNANIYIGGSRRACVQANLNAAWVTQTTNVGWGLIPTWVGPQALNNDISTNLTTARNQGIAEANSALNAAAALGLGAPTIIYYDMEAYATNNTALRDAVKAFLNGWDEQIHNRGSKAGIYGSTYGSAVTDWASIPTPPDAVWIAIFPVSSTSYNPTSTVWGLGISDSLWPNHQRIHQYTGGHPENYGGVLINIDCDAIDSPVATKGLSDGDLIKGSQIFIYVYYHGIRFYIPNPAVLNASGYNINNTKTIPDAQLNAIPEAPDGTLIQEPGSTPGWRGFWVLYKKTRFYIPSMAVFNAAGYNQNDLITLPTAMFNTFAPAGDGTLIQEPVNTPGWRGIWVIYNGVRFNIPSLAVFDASGYRGDKVGTLPTPMFNTISDNTNGTLLKSPGTGAIYLMENGKKRPFPNEAAVVSLGYSLSNVHPMPDPLLNTIPTGSSMVSSTTPNGLQYYPLPKPIRLLETRPGQTGFYAPGTPLVANTPRNVLAAGLNYLGTTIPANAKALVGNATVVNSGNAAGYVTLYPGGTTAPLAANLTYTPGQTVPNSFTVGLGSDGSFNILALTSVDMIIDISGYYAPPVTTGLYYHSLPKPIRLLETRPGQAGAFTPGTPLVANSSKNVGAAGVSYQGVNIPANAKALLGNATVVNNTGAGPGFVTLHPGGTSVPLAANLTYDPGQTVPNSFTVGLGSDGSFNIFALTGINIVVDIMGYYSEVATDANGVGLLYQSLAKPIRLLETRPGQAGAFTPGTPLVGNSPKNIVAANVLYQGVSIPANAQALSGNATVVNSTGAGPGFVTIYPGGVPVPLTANLTYLTAQVVPNSFTVGLGSDGSFNILALTGVHIVIDVSGYFTT